MTQDKWAQDAQSFYSRSAKEKSQPQTHAAFAQAYSALLGRIPGLDRSRVLDLGCGCGHLNDSLSVIPLTLTGVDISMESLSLARSMHPRAAYVQGDMTTLPFANGSFDAVIATTSIEFCSDRPKALQEVRRLLRLRGTAYFEMRNADFALFRLPGFLLKSLRKIGFLKAYGPPDFRDLSYKEWVEMLMQEGFSVEAQFSSLRPWRYGSPVTRLKNLLIRAVTFVLPIRQQYMVGFLCRVN